MILAVDIGNTSISLGVFEASKLVCFKTVASDGKKSSDEYGIAFYNLLKHANLENKIQGSVIASVVMDLTDKIREGIENYLNVKSKIINYKTNSGIKFLLDKPEELGADRIANAVGAKNLYKTPLIVVDFGTATTFDVLDAEGNFIGGLIAPGLRIQAQSLSKFTSKLPHLKIEAGKNAIGKNTVDAMLSGIVRGHACMIDGMIELCEKELTTTATLVATGGYSSIVTDNLKRKFDFENKYLTLEGLKILYEMNG